ncbi:hypothetical protein GGX14DRAFT_399314 [Mycena pura]|uniref:Uncharacterized protein n=1 Tax=Mycena pura TaxID=153505 RepID=A0AAD6V4L9_9AGAR|nr:hypothetical protein GGX14DRAFT_399314 [Mycena pura]
MCGKFLMPIPLYASSKAISRAISTKISWDAPANMLKLGDLRGDDPAQDGKLAVTAAGNHRAHIDVLGRERAELQKNFETIVYPILTIPDEVSSQIFLLFLPARSAPLSLAQT